MQSRIILQSSGVGEALASPKERLKSPLPHLTEGIRSGFTLMEVLIAIAILGIVMAIVYGSFVQTKRVIGMTEVAVDELRGVRTAFKRITLDLSMAFIVQNSENTIFIGTDDYYGGYSNDSVDFTSFANRMRNKDARESDQMEAGYYIERSYDGDSVLMKREKRRIDSNPTYGGKIYEISEEVLGLNFRYLEQGAWLDSWDSRVSKRLPEAVEITITIKDLNGTERSYRSIAEIPLGKRS